MAADVIYLKDRRRPPRPGQPAAPTAGTVPAAPLRAPAGQTDRPVRAGRPDWALSPADRSVGSESPSCQTLSPAGRVPADRVPNGRRPVDHGAETETVRRRGPTPAQRIWLERGLAQAGGKLPLFDGNGQRVNPRTIKACLKRGWAEPWFANPVKPNWLVCKLTDAGRSALEGADGFPDDGPVDDGPADDEVPD